MIVQIGDYGVKAEKCVSIKFNINSDEISYVQIEK